MEVPLLKPDEQGELAVPFIAPATPGHYERYVNLKIKLKKKIFYMCHQNQGNTCYCQF